MSSEKNSSRLSCNGESTQSFLSCALSHRNKLLTSKNFNRKGNSPASLSCGSSKSSESGANAPSLYRANGTNGAKSAAKTLILGIDPGITGALAFISGGLTPSFISVFDFPTYEIQRKGNARKRIDLEALSFLIESYSKDIILSLVEEVGEIRTQADPFSAFAFGFATGSVHGVLAAFAIPVKTITPQVWKAALGLDASKEKSLAKAIRIFPDAAPYLSRKKDHGRAEALLLAYFAFSISKRGVA
jgi:crossover junction endodeoxyribonuclease RuvC